ncbi:MAG TPA: hypothetical protein VMW95_06710 [Desulfobacterales bacterium]|nr:hypothetical protein [Desulfobacterales bacterium]
MNLELLFPIIIEVAKKAIDAIVKGENVGIDGIKGIQTAYAAATIWGPDLVASSVTTIDDQGLAAFLELCKGTADEGDFKLPTM